ncbi:fungal-specific transcription factor domain-containing protein [Crassisporium funariophilum]|nr:fungal-specific transcription factor domain-containing protein [Crassisporium funariophilum]
MSSESPQSHDSTVATSSRTTESRKRSAEPSADKRVPLACHRCRTKRARCSGDKPVCAACAKANEECIWPSGRKRKRTRKEMEEEERREREAALMHSSSSNGMRGVLPSPLFTYSTPQKDVMAWSSPPMVNDANTAGLWGYTPEQSSGPSLLWSATNHSTQNPILNSIPHHQLPDTALPGDNGCSSNSPQMRRAGNTQLFRAIESQVAFIDGDPSRHEELELFYYRFSGSTAIRPGINRISLKLQPRTITLQSELSSPLPSDQPSPAVIERPEDLFDEAGLPYSSVYIPLFDIFFSTLSCHFPSISRRRMEERLKTGTMSAFLLNCICAISARFSPPNKGSAMKACAPFITKAQELIIPLLHLPTTDVVTGLLLLAWANYGQNSESGLWQYSGMAIRMAIDLGLHEISDIYESSAHVVRTRLLFWSLFITDRVLAFATGRPPSISEELIDIPLPSDEDFVPDPAISYDATSTAPEIVQPTPFTHIVRLMVLCGRIANVLNGRRGRPCTLVGASEPNFQLLNTLQIQLVQFYSDLPNTMKWSVDAFKHQEERGHGGTFLTLHLWANSVLALVYHPELMSHPSGMETPLSQHMDRSVKLSLSSSRIITECLVFADLFASRSYLASPFAVQPIFVACLAFIHEMKINELMGVQEKAQTVDLLLTSLARQNVGVLIKALQRMEQYWAGVSYVLGILEQKAAGLGLIPSTSPMNITRTFISLPDKGLLRRFTSKDPATAPPTETSLRMSMAKEASESNTCSLDDLFNAYSIEGFFVQPAESFEIDGLLPSGYRSSESGNSM